MRLRFLLFFLFGLFLVLGVVWWIGPKEVFEEVVKVRLEYLLLLFLLQVLAMVLWAFRWSIVLKHSGVSFRSVFPVSLVGYLINNMTPIGVAGGEFARGYLLARLTKLSTAKSAASVIVDLFLDVVPVFFLLLLAISFIAAYHIPSAIIFVLALGCLVLVLIAAFVFALVADAQLSLRMIRYVVSFFSVLPLPYLREHALDAQTRVDKIVVVFQDAMTENMTDSTIMFSGFFVSLLTWVVSVLRMYFAFKAIGVEVPLMVLLVVRIIVMTVSFIPFTPGSIGLWEGLTTFMFSLFYIKPATALAATLLERFFSFWIGSLIGVAAVAYLGVWPILKERL